MRIALGCVEEQVCDFCAADVQVFWGDVGKDYAGGDVRTCPGVCGGEEVLLAEIGKAKEPEDGGGERR